MKGLKVFIYSLLAFSFTEVQGNPLILSRINTADSIIRVSGYVLDSITGDPVINAVLSYEELPFGNSIGILKVNRANGFFEFNTYGNHEGYRIEVKAQGYQTIIDFIYPKSEGKEGQLLKKYLLADIPMEGELIRLDNLIFEQGKSEITPASFRELDNLVKMMRENQNMVIRLEGHTDFRGSKTQNMKLSEDRVVEVKEYLVRKSIDGNRILTKAYGGTRPITREETEEASSLNRRVEVRIIKK